MRKLVFLFFILILAACKENSGMVQTETKNSNINTIDTQSELESIEKTRQTFMKAVKENDLETIGQIVTPDLKTVSPGSSDWKDMYAMSKKQGPFPYDSIIMNPKETIIVSDSVAYDMGESRVFYTSDNGSVVELKDTFLAILKKGKDGTWRLHREVASSNVNE